MDIDAIVQKVLEKLQITGERPVDVRGSGGNFVVRLQQQAETTGGFVPELPRIASLGTTTSPYVLSASGDAPNTDAWDRKLGVFDGTSWDDTTYDCVIWGGPRLVVLAGVGIFQAHDPGGPADYDVLYQADPAFPTLGKTIYIITRNVTYDSLGFVAAIGPEILDASHTFAGIDT